MSKTLRATVAPWAPKIQPKIEAAAKARIEGVENTNGNSGEKSANSSGPKLRINNHNNNVALNIKVTKEISQHFAFCNMCAPTFFVPMAAVYAYDSAKTLIDLIRNLHAQYGVGCPINICRFNEEWLNEVMDTFHRYEFTRYHPTFYTMRRKCDHGPKYYGYPADTNKRGVETKWYGMV